MAMLTSACLVTESPDFDPKQAPPSLFSHELTPTTVIKKVFADEATTTFRARVLSEEIEGAPLTAVLLLDYGLATSESGPWRKAAGEFLVSAGRLSEGPREVDPAAVFSFTDDLDVGCHTITLAASHAFRRELGEFYCPADANDFATLTWFVTRCDTEGNCPLDNCPVDVGGGTHAYCTFDDGEVAP